MMLLLFVVHNNNKLSYFPALFLLCEDVGIKNTTL